MNILKLLVRNAYIGSISLLIATVHMAINLLGTPVCSPDDIGKVWGIANQIPVLVVFLIIWGLGVLMGLQIAGKGE